MDNLNAFSLFDFFSFLVPGFLLEIAALSVFRLSGIQAASLLPANDALRLFFVVFSSYVAGHVLHHLVQNISWFGVRRLRRKNNGLDFLSREAALAQGLNKVAADRFSLSFKEADGKINEKEADRFFEIAYRILENADLLRTSRNLQTQFLMFCSLYLCSLTGAFLTVFVLAFRYLYLESHGTFVQACVLVGLFIACALLCYRIAAQRRALFLQTAWWQFYSFFYHEQSTKATKATTT